MATEIEKLFGSRTRARILGWFFTHTGESFFVRQLSSILREDPTNLSRELSRLESIGILVSKKEGNLKHHTVNRACPFYNELKGLVSKTVGVVGQIRSGLHRLSGINYGFIYGSFATSQETAMSDVDIMIIGDIDIDELDRIIHRIEKEVGREVNYILYSLEEFKIKKASEDNFVISVLSGKKIMLIGKENELAAA